MTAALPSNVSYYLVRNYVVPAFHTAPDKFVNTLMDAHSGGTLTLSIDKFMARNVRKLGKIDGLFHLG